MAELMQPAAASTSEGGQHTSLPSYLAFGTWDILPSRVVGRRRGKSAQIASPSLGVETRTLVPEMPIASVEGMAAWAPHLVGVQMVVEVGILDFGEAVAELEHLGPPVGTEMKLERAAAVVLPPLRTLNRVWHKVGQVLSTHTQKRLGWEWVLATHPRLLLLGEWVMSIQTRLLLIHLVHRGCVVA